MRRTGILAALAAIVATAAQPALAYVGPGAGLGAIGAALGLLGAVILALGVLLFWPIRRLLRRGKAKRAAASGAAAPDSRAAE